jgi:drug/metabolite transporter, DME family
VLSGAALFGTVGTAQILGPQLSPEPLAAARLLLAGALLLAIALATGSGGRFVGCLRAGPTWWAGVAQVSFNICFLGAMREAGVAVGTLVAIGATPVLTGIVARQVSRGWLVATGVAVSGLVLLVVGQATTTGAAAVHPSVAGIALALGASASYATYIIAGNKALGRGLSIEPYLAMVFVIAGLVSAPLLLAPSAGDLVGGPALLLVGYLAVVATVLAYNLFNRGLGGVRSSTASTLGLLEPVVAAVLAVLLLGERLSLLGAGGALLILAGLALIVHSTRNPGRPIERSHGAGMGQSPGA